ncbi:MAG TPA: LacI family DNA-binding transcriptional regulator [Nocardioidaceae bacterium]|nr:LacI family DNA-binding transcriptional regulator [Nocardioidaceae bacterium]
MPRRRGRAPTLATVADEAGVSRQTVSNALNSPHLLRPETLARVQHAIDTLGYSPNRAARNLRTRASHLIGLRVEPAAEGTANVLMDRFLHSLVESSDVAGYHVLLFADDEERADPVAGYADLLRSTAVDAFVVTDTYRGNPQAGWLERQGAPFVAFGRPWDDSRAKHPWVDVDGRAGVGLAVDHLVERGHSRIAWIGWLKDSFIGEDRRSGWVDTMHAHRLSTSRLSARGDDTVDFGRRAAHALLESEEPTAFVCASDTIAMGVLHALSERRLRAGEDVAVVGFDDSIAAQVAPPGLTSVRQPLEQVAREIVGLLGKRLSHKHIDEPGLLLTPTLVVRGSG